MLKATTFGLALLGLIAVSSSGAFGQAISGNLVGTISDSYKDINITERVKFRIGAQFANLFNHPQFIPGSNPGQGLGVNDVTSFITGPNSTSYLNYLTPGNAIFNNPRAVFASNARTIGLVAKFTF
jgi:hypothetical protein